MRSILKELKRLYWIGDVLLGGGRKVPLTCGGKGTSFPGPDIVADHETSRRCVSIAKVGEPASIGDADYQRNLASRQAGLILFPIQIKRGSAAVL
jgi:hypothetical protein